MSISHLEYLDFVPDIEKFRLDIHWEVLESDAQAKANELVEFAAKELKPSFGGVVLPVQSFSVLGDTAVVKINEKVFEGKAVTKLIDCCTVAPYFVTCGTQLENLNHKAIDFMADYWIDSIKKQALEQAREKAVSFFKNELKSVSVSSINPGSGNIGYWDIKNLSLLFDVLKSFNCLSDIKLTESMCMIPNKSVCGVFFPSVEENRFVTCSECTRANCPSRKVKYRCR